MRILSVETATTVASVSLEVDGAFVAELSAPLRSSPSTMALDLIDEVLKRGGLTLGDLDMVGVGIGPGSFTGVRVGLATAKGIHIASGVEVVGVSSLEAVASAHSHLERFAVALDASRGEAFIAGFECSPDGTHRRSIAQFECVSLSRAGEVFRSVAGDRGLPVVGNLGEREWASVIESSSGAVLAVSRDAFPRARWVAVEARLGRGRSDEGALEPAYVRASDAKLPETPLRALSQGRL